MFATYPATRLRRPPRPNLPGRRTTVGYLTLQNKHASQPEFWFGKGLEYWGFEYLFQASYFGGRRLAGGFVLDFLVFTRPLPTPVWINGEYWHRGQQLTLDALQQFVVRSFKNVAPPVIVWAKDLQSFEDGRRVVRRLLR